MPLHDDMKQAIAAMEAFGFRPMESLTPSEARQQTEEMARARGVVEIAGTVESRDIPGPYGEIPVRIYRPGGAAPETALPALVYFHGGGHVIGSMDTHESVAVALSEGAGIAVVSVAYHKAPEHKFPAAAEDCFQATCWVHEHADKIGIDGSRMAVGGDSAGANLAAVVALMARDAGAPSLRLQILVYPITDYACSAPSYGTFATGYGALTRDAMLWFKRHYLNTDQDAADWRASPLKAACHDGLAPAFVVTAECDVLLDDSLAYIECLNGAGVAVEHAHFEGMIHGFFSMPASIQASAEAQSRAVAALGRALA